MQSFEPVQPYRMAKQIVSRIYNMILDGEIPAGDRLPSERTLAGRFNVSRPTLRVAIHVLEALGLVRVRPGGGTYLSKNPIALSPQILEHLLHRDGELLFELIDVRVEFETRNAELAARNATAKDVLDLAACWEVMRADVEAGQDDFRHDIDFHLGIAKATQNRVRVFITTSMLQAHVELLREARRRQRHLVKEFLGEHRAIYLAIREKNPAKARRAMKAHIEAGYERGVQETVVATAESCKVPKLRAGHS